MTSRDMCAWVHHQVAKLNQLYFFHRAVFSDGTAAMSVLKSHLLRSEIQSRLLSRALQAGVNLQVAGSSRV